MIPLGRLLIAVGILLVLVGLILNYFPFLRLGHLPGDITVRRGNFTFCFPLTTCIFLSLVLTLLIYLFRK